MPADQREARLPASVLDAASTSLLCVWVGDHQLVFVLESLLAIEGSLERVDHTSIRGPIDLRTWLDVEPRVPAGETLLVPGEQSIYRLQVCQVNQLVQSDLKAVYPPPSVLTPLTNRLHLRGVVLLEAGDDTNLAWLVDPRGLAEAAWSEGEGAA